MATFISDIRVAMRRHLRQRAFALAVVSTIGLTVGATAAVFSVVNAVLVRGLPFDAPDRLMWVSSIRPDNPNAPFTLPEYVDYRSRTRSLSGLAAYANWSASLSGDGITERLRGARVSGNIFKVLGLTAAAGRLLADADDEPDAAPVVVVSYALWQRRFGGAADVIGTTARINGVPYTIAGVLPPQFLLPILTVDIVTALQPESDPLRHQRGSVNFLRFIGRLGDATTAEQAQAELTTICKALREQFPVEYVRKEAVRTTLLQDVIVGDHRRPLLILMGAVVVMLATAAANLISMALVRASARRGELVTRLAVGASRAQLWRLLAVETALLAVAGLTAGLVVAMQAIAAVRTWAPRTLPRLSEITLDGDVVAFAVLSTTVVAALLTAIPLFAIAHSRAADALRAGRGSLGERLSIRIRHLLVVFEIAAALVLLLATAVLIRGLHQLNTVPLGFESDGVFQAQVSLPPSYRTPDDIARFFDRLSGRLQSSPGVERVALISVAPLSGLLRTVPFTVEGEPAERGRPMANLREISAAYLETVRIRLVEGRGFTENDRANTPHVALVSAALADRLLEGKAIGRRLLINDNNLGPRPIEIVGVVGNVRHVALDAPAELDVYLPLRQVHQDGVTALRTNQFWMMRVRSAPAALRGVFVDQLRQVDPDAAVSGGGSLRDLIDGWLGPRRFTLGLFGAFALSAVLVAVSGLAGLVAYAVSQRRQEIGLRIAIGATPRDVVLLVVRQAAMLAVIAFAGGIGVAYVSSGLLAGLIGDAGLTPGLIAATASLLMCSVMLAAWLPARRAARIDPTLALRAE